MPTPPPPYTLTQTPEPHAIRRKALLRAHPEIRDWFGWDRHAVPVMLAAVTAQPGLAAWAQATWDPAKPVCSAAWTALLVLTIGAVLSHWSSMFLHEASHNNCAPTPRANRFWGSISTTWFILARLSTIPSLWGNAPPDRLVPPPRLTMGIACSLQTDRTPWTCLTLSGKTTRRGTWRYALSPSHS